MKGKDVAKASTTYPVMVSVDWQGSFWNCTMLNRENTERIYWRTKKVTITITLATLTQPHFSIQYVHFGTLSPSPPPPPLLFSSFLRANTQEESASRARTRKEDLDIVSGRRSDTEWAVDGRNQEKLIGKESFVFVPLFGERFERGFFLSLQEVKSRYLKPNGSLSWTGKKGAQWGGGRGKEGRTN